MKKLYKKILKKIYKALPKSVTQFYRKFANIWFCASFIP